MNKPSDYFPHGNEQTVIFAVRCGAKRIAGK
jgi:hypothetical protein